MTSSPSSKKPVKINKENEAFSSVIKAGGGKYRSPLKAGGQLTRNES
jgi:hypothetical protein